MNELYIAWEFVNNEPKIIGIFDNEQKVKGIITDGCCYNSITLNYIYPENIKTKYHYKLNNEWIVKEF